MITFGSPGHGGHVRVLHVSTERQLNDINNVKLAKQSLKTYTIVTSMHD